MKHPKRCRIFLHTILVLVSAEKVLVFVGKENRNVFRFLSPYSGIDLRESPVE